MCQQFFSPFIKKKKKKNSLTQIQTQTQSQCPSSLHLQQFSHFLNTLITQNPMSKLELRELGNTGLKLNCVGFGALPLGNVFGIVSEEEANASVREAFRLGINFVDTSPHCSTRSCTGATPVGSSTYSTTWTR